MKLLFPEAEVTRSLSNMIKAYSVRYKEELRKIDVEEREEAIHAKVAEAILANSFVGGLQAITLTEDGEVAAIAGAAEAEGEGIPVDGEDGENAVAAGVPHPFADAAALEAWKEEERQKLKAELTQAERLALRIEMEKAIRTQADVILEQARAQGEQVKVKSKLAAEAERLEILETAKKEGYEEGRQKLLEEPMAVEVITKLLEGLTGVLLETKQGIVTYLVSKALSEAERSDSFLIKVSKEDFEEVKGASDTFRRLFEREITLEVVQDVLLKKGECMIETDSNIIDCSLGTQLEGLLADIRLLGVQERM